MMDTMHHLYIKDNIKYIFRYFDYAVLQLVLVQSTTLRAEILNAT